MKVIKITNIKREDGSIDYKGLDINQFIPGKQVYDGNNSTACLITKEDILPNHPDIIEITETEYLNEKVSNTPPDTPSMENQIKELQSQNAQMMLALVLNDLI